VNKQILITAALLGAMINFPALAADYKVDPAHSFIEFKINHLGMSWLHGRFNSLSGALNYDQDKPDESRISVKIDPASVDTNHAERDKHLRSEDFLDVRTYPEASFNSSAFSATDNGGTLTGLLTMHGTSKEISIDVEKIGEGKDPWGNYRVGFAGTTELVRNDFDLGYNLGPAARTLQLELTIEGIRQN